MTHALVHQYVGTKDDLLSAVIQRVSRDRAAIVHDSPDLETAVDVIARQILANRLHSKSLVRSAMDDVEYVSLHERVRTGHALIELIARSRALGGAPAPPPADLDPRVIVGALAALLFGWAATEEWAWSMFGLDPSDKECVYGELLKIAHYIADLAYVTSNAQQGES